MPVPDTIFQQVAVVLAVSAALAALASRLRQPLILAFIAAGILVGPQGVTIVEEPAEIELLATIGISLLLFVVGLKLDVRLIRRVGPVALATGLGQVMFTSGIGYLLALALGLQPVAALYVAVALTFSSTIIIIKILSDKRETEDLHGRIAIGFLIVQDIVVVLVMIGLSAFGDPAADVFALELAFVLLRGAAFIGGIVALMRWVLPPLLHRMAHHPELLLLFAITWAVALAAVGDLLGFSGVVGAFLGGVALASTPYRDAIAGRLTSLRDFLLVFFFIDLGVHLDLGRVADDLVAAVVLSLFVLIGNPLIVLVIMGLMGYRKRVSFLAGLTVAQISEFSLILVTLGMGLGHIAADTVGLVTAVGLITIGASTYLIYNSHALFERLGGALSVFERTRPRPSTLEMEETPSPEVVVIGLGRFGSTIVDGLRREGVRLLAVDFDPQAVREWAERGVDARYGDAEDPELASALPLSDTRWVVSTVRRLDANLALFHGLREHHYRGRLALSADSAEEAEALTDAGVDLVLMPLAQAAQQALAALLTGR
jgi:Kef-type K+ transport system membrane component KefB